MTKWERPMLNTPFPPWPCFSDEEADAVRAVLKSNRVNYWTGDECRHFEQEFAAWADCTHGVAVANGTLALELALRALGIGPGDDVIVTPRSFIASVSCVLSVGARPVFADVDRDSQNISAATIADVLTPHTRAIICVHLAGWPCDMDPIMELARERDLFVIEDCAQAHGARYKGRSVGSIGHIGAWSFCQDKIMTTGGEGGMATTNDPDLWSAMWSYKDHGKSWDAIQRNRSTSSFRWIHDSFGSNWRMMEMQAVIGRLQLRRMPDWHALRLTRAHRIWAAAGLLPGLRVPRVPEHSEHAAYKGYVFVEPEQLLPGWSRDRILLEIQARGVPCYTGSCSEIYLEKAFEGTGLRPAGHLPIARELGETALMFLLHPTLSDTDIERTCLELADVMHSATRRHACA